MARARGSNAIMAAAFETTYGTRPSTGYMKLPFVSSNLGEEQGLIGSELLGYVTSIVALLVEHKTLVFIALGLFLVVKAAGYVLDGWIKVRTAFF